MISRKRLAKHVDRSAGSVKPAAASCPPKDVSKSAHWLTRPYKIETRDAPGRASRFIPLQGKDDRRPIISLSQPDRRSR